MTIFEKEKKKKQKSRFNDEKKLRMLCPIDFPFCQRTLPFDAIVWQWTMHKRRQPRQIPAFTEHNPNVFDATEIVLFRFLVRQSAPQQIPDMIKQQQASKQSTNRIDQIDEQVILSGGCVHGEHGQWKYDFQKCPRIVEMVAVHRPNEEMIV